MRKDRNIILITVVVLLLFSGCNENAMKKITVSNSGNIRTIITEQYADEEMDSIMQVKGSIEELNARYPVRCYREKGNETYAVYLSPAYIGIVYFQNDRISHCLKLCPKHDYKEYASIEMGTSISAVMEFDPDANYLFLHTGVNLPRISTHYTKDGFVVKIQYDESGNVSGITAEEI